MSLLPDGGACFKQTCRARSMAWSVATIWFSGQLFGCSEERVITEPSSSAASPVARMDAMSAQPVEPPAMPTPSVPEAGPALDATTLPVVDAATLPLLDAAAAPPEASAPMPADAGAVGQDAASSAASTPDAATTPSLCSGCPQQATDLMDMTIHLHHVHLRAADRKRSGLFYEQNFAAERVTLNAAGEVWHAPPILLLIDESPIAPSSSLPTALQHIGWGAADPAAWYEAAHARGVAPDTRGHTLFNTNETPTVGQSGSGASTFTLLGVEPPACFPIPDAFSYMYVLGPDGERIEVWSGADLRVNHLHFTTPDLTATMRWYQRFLKLPADTGSLLFSAFFIDDVLFFFEPIGQAADYGPSEDHVLSHVAFSVTDLDAWLARARDQGLQIVAPPASTYGFKSFFVRGPDGVLIELVQAAPSGELCPSARNPAR